MVGKVSAGRRKMVSNVRASIGVGLLVGLTLSLLMWGLSASPAQAETLTDCQADIDQAKALLTDTTNPNYIDSFTNEKDREGLVGKLEQEDADVLLVEINEAIGSIEGLQAQTPTAA